MRQWEYFIRSLACLHHKIYNIATVVWNRKSHFLRRSATHIYYAKEASNKRDVTLAPWPRRFSPKCIKLSCRAWRNLWMDPYDSKDKRTLCNRSYLIQHNNVNFWAARVGGDWSTHNHTSFCDQTSIYECFLLRPVTHIEGSARFWDIYFRTKLWKIFSIRSNDDQAIVSKEKRADKERECHELTRWQIFLLDEHWRTP